MKRPNGFRPVYIQATESTSKNIRCLAIARGMSPHDHLNQLLYWALKPHVFTMPELRPDLRSAKRRRFFLKPKVKEALQSCFHRKRKHLQQFIQDLILMESFSLGDHVCICGCGVPISPFQDPKTGDLRWFEKGHNLYILASNRPREEKLLKILHKAGRPLNIEEIAFEMDQDRKSISNFCSELQRLNIIRRVGRGLYTCV